jgi:hypothetical protein
MFIGEEVMGIEKRRSKRTDIDVIINIKEVNDKYPLGMATRPISVNVINLSRDGIAFKTTEKLEINSFYDTIVKLDNSDSFNAVVEILRTENPGEPETTYGCRFVGISSEQQFKIDVYQIVKENA